MLDAQRKFVLSGIAERSPDGEVIGEVEACGETFVMKEAPTPSSANQDEPEPAVYRKVGTTPSCPSQASRLPSIDG